MNVTFRREANLEPRKHVHEPKVSQSQWQAEQDITSTLGCGLFIGLPPCYIRNNYGLWQFNSGSQHHGSHQQLIVHQFIQQQLQHNI